jgi:hypothetical protein
MLHAALEVFKGRCAGEELAVKVEADGDRVDVPL